MCIERERERERERDTHNIKFGQVNKIKHIYTNMHTHTKVHIRTCARAHVLWKRKYVYIFTKYQVFYMALTRNKKFVTNALLY